jgi:hypothetical protein
MDRKIDPANVWQEYPRPIMERTGWQNLNGLWDYTITLHQSIIPKAIDKGKILVPFPVESSLSGVQRELLPHDMLWYKRGFTIPDGWRGKEILLHFDAVDFQSSVWVNGRAVGTHEGSSDRFTFNITPYLKEGTVQELVVSVIDSTDVTPQPVGKQTLRPRGIKYTAVSGIWKTVWLEPVNKTNIRKFEGVANIDNSTYTLTVNTNTGGNEQVKVTALDKGHEVTSVTGRPGEALTLKIPAAKLWAPDHPFLYDLQIELSHNGQSLDKVNSYFAMRKISVGKDKSGINRIMLNNQPLFQYGMLDQGWWPDGLLTPPCDEALKYDIEFTLNAGFNVIRKHIKIEPERFYYHCDRMGVLVWQDAVCSSEYNLKNSNPGKNPRSARQFEAELKRMVDQLYNYPSIVLWVVFNEGWGQYGGTTWIDWTKQRDPSRLVSVSGWVDMGNGDVCDVHRYPGPGRIENSSKARAFAVGEFGGLGLPVTGHTWMESDKNWGYATYIDPGEFRKAYEHMVYELDILVDQGLSAAIYTQTTDVEIETNGMLTYDRKVEKIPAGDLKALHRKLWVGKTSVKEYLPDSEKKPQMWKYVFTEPATGWDSERFDDHGWKTGPASFGYNHPNFQLGYPVDERTDFAHIPKTTWNTGQIWLRKTFDLKNPPQKPVLKVSYDDAALVYINGQKVLDISGRTAHYSHHGYYPIPEGILRKEKNTIAVYCTNDMGRQGNQVFDLGIMEIVYQ